MSDFVQPSDTVTYHYLFAMDGGARKGFTVKLDRATLRLVHTERESYPDWSRLACCQCPNCSLDKAHEELCPVAASVVDLVDCFRSSSSVEEVDVLVETETRSYAKRTTLQKGLSSLLGLYMPTTGCPVLGRLRPMARNHIPFATLQENTCRLISAYVLSQYFLLRRGQGPDWDLKGLVRMCDDIRLVNQSFCRRLSQAKISDASVNAVVALNTLADFVAVSIDHDLLDEIEPEFDLCTQ